MQFRTVLLRAAVPFAFTLVTILTGTSAMAQSEKILYSFAGSKNSDGSFPSSNLIFDQVGNLYGTTEKGGAYSGGTVFELSPATSGSWTEKVLYSFGSGADGVDPKAGLTFDSVGNLYGTTYQGGAYGYGTVFELSSAGGGGWTESVLHNFGSATDGRNPESKLTIDSPGNLYGTTLNGGTYTCGGTGCGVVFELSATKGGWREAVLHNFGNGCTQPRSNCDGANPNGGVILDSSGHLYGATTYGGTSLGECFCGAVYDMERTAKGTWLEGVISRKVQYPTGDLVFDSAGNLYGANAQYNCNFGECGSVFELSPGTHAGWTEITLHNFGSNTGLDGADPVSGLIFDPSSDSFYGTTPDSLETGTQWGQGTVYELSAGTSGTWTLTVLYLFEGGGNDGASPRGIPVLDSSGNLYGTTYSGGTHGLGTVYEVTP